MKGPGRRLLLSPFLGVLREAITPELSTHPQVIVPNRRAGHELTRWGSHGPRPRTLTRVAQEALGACGWTALRSGERERWIRALLADIPLTLLAPIRERDGTVACVTGLLAEFQRAHLQPDALLPVARPGREQDVALLYAAYHARCRAERRYDAAGAEHHASLLADLPRQPTVVHGFAYLDATQTSLVDRLCGPGSVMTLPAGPGTAAGTLKTGAALQARGWSGETLGAPAQTAGDQAIHGFLTGTAVRDLTAGEYPDIDREVRACLRQVRDWLADGTPPERLAVVVRSEGQYLETLADVAAEYGIPLRSGLQRPLLDSGLGRLLQAWVDAHAQGWTFRACEALLTHPLVAQPDLIERARALRIARPAGPGAWEDGLHWLVLPETTTWRAALTGTVQRMLRHFGVLHRCREDAHLNTLTTRFLQRLQDAARRDTPCTRDEVLSCVAFTLRSIQLPALTGRSAVPVLNPLGALACTAERVWILGLSSGIFPAGRRDHELIDAHTRQRWSARGVHLPDVRDLASVEDALILAMLGTAQSALVVSRPRRDLGGLPLLPSPYWTRLQAGRAASVLDAASGAERDVHAALGGQPTVQAQQGRALEETRRLRLPTGHGGQLGHGLDVSGRTWTLPELQVATTCRMRWWLEDGLKLSPPSLPWELLAYAAFEGTVTGEGHPSAPALDRAARQLQGAGTWRPGPLWPAQRLELLHRAQRVIAAVEGVPDTRFLPAPRERTLSVAAHGHRFRIRCRVDRLEDTPQGRRVTVYRRAASAGGVDGRGALTLDMQLALTLQAAPAEVGQYLALDTGAAFGRLRHVARPTADSPLTQAREVLAQLGDRLAAGDVQPLPAPAELCRRCPVRAVCRSGQPAVAA